MAGFRVHSRPQIFRDLTVHYANPICGEEKKEANLVALGLKVPAEAGFMALPRFCGQVNPIMMKPIVT